MVTSTHCAQVPELLGILLTETHDRRDYFDTLQPLLLACSQRLAECSNADADVFAAAVADLSKLAADLTGKRATSENDRVNRQSAAPASSAQTTANSKRRKKQKATHHRSDTEPVAAFFCGLAACAQVPAAMQVLFALLSVTACSGNCTTADATAVSELVSTAVPSAQMAEPAAKAIGDGFAALGVACKCRQSALGSLVSTTLRPTSQPMLKRNVFEEVPCQIPAQGGKTRPRAWFARVALCVFPANHNLSLVQSFTGLPRGLDVRVSYPTYYNSAFQLILDGSAMQSKGLWCCMWNSTPGREGVHRRLLQVPCDRWEDELQLAGVPNALVLDVPSSTPCANFLLEDAGYDYHLLLVVYQ